MISIPGWSVSIIGLRSTTLMVSGVEGAKPSGVERLQEG